MAGLIGIFGGTFDPPHVGHLILAAEAKEQLGLDRLLWVLTPDPPHKQERRISPLEDRLALLHAALEDNADFEISRVDMDRPSPHYAVETVHLLRDTYPNSSLIYMMGEDSLRDLHSWYAPEAFVRAVDRIGVMRRPGNAADLTDVESVLPGISAKLSWVEAPLVDISGSEIRRRAAAGRTFRYFVLPVVYELIVARRLYANAGVIPSR